MPKTTTSSRAIPLLLLGLATAALASAPALSATPPERGLVLQIRPQSLFFIAPSSDPAGIYFVDLNVATQAGPINGDFLGDPRDLVVRRLGGRLDVIVANAEPGFARGVTPNLLRYGDLLVGDPVTTPLFANIIADALQAPTGLSLAPNGDLYFVDDVGGTAKVYLAKRNGIDYDLPVFVDEAPPSTVLVDTQVVNFNLSAFLENDLVVLSQSPPGFLRYRHGSPCADTTNCQPIERRFIPLPAVATLTSFVFTPGGDLLIATDDGRILRFRLRSETLDPGPFAGGLGAGKAKLVAGVQDDGMGTRRPFVFYANESQGQIRRFFANTGVEDPTNPYPVPNVPGIGIGTGQAAPILTGTDVRVQPTDSLVMTHDEVTKDGLADAEVHAFADPRPDTSCESVPPTNLYLCAPNDPNVPGCAAKDGDYVVDLGLLNIIPCYIRPLPILTGAATQPLSGGYVPRKGMAPEPLFMLARVTTTAGFDQTVKLQALEEKVLGNTPHCEKASFNLQPRLFHGVDPEEPRVVEGLFFGDISTGCGSNFGRTFAFSEFLVARDTRSRLEVVSFKLQRLLDALDPSRLPEEGGLSSYIDPTLLELLTNDAMTAAGEAGAQEYASAIATLESFIQKVRNAPAAAIDNSKRNALGELLVRAISSIFLACDGTDCSSSVDNHAEDLGLVFFDAFESGDVSPWTAFKP